MSVFENADFDNHESVTFFDDESCGLKAIVAVHSTSLGTALGGIRVQPYESSAAALNDVLRLSRGMSYKNALAELPLGGGKMVVIARPEDKNEALLLGMGRAVKALGGRYICSVDMNMQLEDLRPIHRVTEYVVPKDLHRDPSLATAHGTLAGIRASVQHKLKTDSLKGVRVAIQGVGKVGQALAQDLSEEGAVLYVADPVKENLDRAVAISGATAVDTAEIHKVECEVFSPCAKGAFFNDTTIPQLNCVIIAGCANNQLANPEIHGEMLRQRRILYAPDYVVNAGGVICVAGERLGWTDAETSNHVGAIAKALSEIFRRADIEGLRTEVVADNIAKQRIRDGLTATAKAAE
jgi:leucine dehydrogenase